ncbi:uncharacterized protein LOC133177001 [Saccostrea echinata]|uniref:uncharacterized protein LOC133177001 n=1 Tax=Saccostrea echinata TaxID=191078 RepID=UPI002A805914|nr:uncharacterized protein LOC133177001 [Saccostrea echinata]
MATSQNQEPVSNGFQNGNSLTERMNKYKVDDEKDTTESNSSGEQSSPLFKDEAERLKHLQKIRASPTSSAASRIKNKTRSYEVLNLPNGTPTYDNLRVVQSSAPKIPARAAALADLPPLVIPKDGNLQSFSVDEMATFFRYMRVNEEIVQRLHRKEMDGRKFGKLKDKTLEDLQIKNPILLHFRDRSSKDRIGFML